ncbi:YbhB/YbcL family Raf kinase inhibitor-like protein [Aureispira anguillae]|uniref:YbhB/YbcL family Raf kinase inhibitor-like protein n=1 Tax=Aureispira anguillae TaxID=2864201 RepID=A0A916DR12_9BACT|nr:YbhB/YbcL family Raf kinase inhibitor-like protein [Aureispira anguillae]BDS10390.1 YbhB/YbcL family Raf kinase inhibitor-like protein [Aureispira anguillae]
MKYLMISLSFLLIANLSFAQTFTLKSTDLGGQATNKEVFDGFGCTGKNTSPQLSWENAPVGTQSFAITMYDPDAPTGSGWWHWVVFDIPKTVNVLKSNAGNITLDLMPEGVVQSLTDYGKTGYGGPCPPKKDGVHQYIITVYALKTPTLNLASSSNPALVGYYLNANAIQKASLVVYYERM